MQSEIAKKLEAIRRTLGEQSAWGPESSFDSDHEKGKAGVSGADNVSDVNDTFYAYLDGIVGSILDEYEMSEEEAVDYVFGVAEDLEADNTLPPMPDEGDLEATAVWLGKAKSMLFGELVLSALDAEAVEDEG